MLLIIKYKKGVICVNSVGNVTVKKVAIIITAIVLLILTVFSASFVFNLRSRDFSSKELVIRGTEAESIEGYLSKEVIGDLTVLKFESEDDARKAYIKNILAGSTENLEVNSYLSICNEVNDAKEYLEGEYSKTELRKYLDSKEITRGTVKVAVLDTGLTISDSNKSLFENRVIDTEVNLSTTGDKNSVEDDNGHGTSVASLIVINSNESVKVLPIKIASKEGKATLSSAYQGIKKAIELEADIINISMSTVESTNSGILREVIEEASSRGIMVVVSAGNLGADVRKFVPANIDSAIVVGAVNGDNTLAEYSNYGSTVDYVSYGSYSGAYGTSSATARVSGVLSDAISRGVDLNTINSYVEDLGDIGKDSKFGYGLLAGERLKITDDVLASKEYESALSNVIRRKKMYDNLCSMNWKTMSDEELNNVFMDADGDIIGLFLHTLSDEDLNLLVSRQTMLASPIDVTDAVVLDKRDDLAYIPQGVEPEVEKYNKAYIYLLKETEDLSVQNIAYANSSGHFYLEFQDAPKAENNGKIKIEISGASEPTSDNVLDPKATSLKVVTYVNDVSGTINDFSVGTPYMVKQGDGTTSWSGLYLNNASFTKPAHTRIDDNNDKDIINTDADGTRPCGDLGQGRLDFWNYVTSASTISYSLDTSLVHKATKETASIECNAYNCGLADPGSGYHNTTLLVTFLQPTYTVTYKGNKATGGSMASKTVACGTVVKHTNKFTRTGYTFKGWALKKDATKAKYDNNARTTICSNLTLYALWEPDGYIVDYDLDGGSGTFNEQTKKHGKDLKLHTGTPTKPRYKFTGWKSNEGDTYKAGDTYKKNKGTTMKAQWSKNEYVVEYNLDGGEGNFPDQIKTHNVDLTLHSGKPTKSGFTFTGWKSSSDNACYEAGGTYSVNADTEMTAQWDVEFVRFDVNGLLGTLDSNGNNVYEAVDHCHDFGTFDVYINGKQVADDVPDFANYYPENSTYKVTDIKPLYSKAYEGYKHGSDYYNDDAAYKTSPSDITGTLTSSSRAVRLKFKSLATCYFDVNGLLGTLDANKNNVYEESGDCSGFGTFDVYINGVLDANDVSDYGKNIVKGSTYKISDIKPLTGKTYDGYKHGANYSNANASYITSPSDITGTITSAVNTRLKFSTIPIYRLKVVYQKQNPDNLSGIISMETTETDFIQGSITNIDDSMDEKTPDGYYLDTAKFGNITMNEDKTLTVNYKLKTYKVNVDPNGGYYKYKDKSITDAFGNTVISSYTNEIFKKDFKYGVWTEFASNSDGTYGTATGHEYIAQPTREGYDFIDWDFVNKEDSEDGDYGGDDGDDNSSLGSTDFSEDFIKEFSNSSTEIQNKLNFCRYFRAYPLNDGDEVTIRAIWVRQWIRRGKLRSAVKAGSEWRIPELSEIIGRGYRRGTFHWDDKLSDVPEE